MSKKQEEQSNITHEELLVLNEALSAQVLDLEVKLKGALADYQNMRREQVTQQELRENILKKHVFSDLIEIFSDLFYAVDQLDGEVRKDSNIEGIVQIMMKYKDLLKNNGVTEITFSEGDEYDADVAEVLGVVTHTEFDNKIAQTIQPGYKIGEVLIKPARVMMYRKTQD